MERCFLLSVSTDTYSVEETKRPDVTGTFLLDLAPKCKVAFVRDKDPCVISGALVFGTAELEAAQYAALARVIRRANAIMKKIKLAMEEN
jgi:hypothetical protein